MNINEKECSKCGIIMPKTKFLATKAFIYSDHLFPMCVDCIDKLIKKFKDDWTVVDRLCQLMDIPFIPNKWYEMYKEEVAGASFLNYNKIFLSEKYSKLNWKQYYDAFKKLEEDEEIDREIPLVSENNIKKMQSKWGQHYDFEELEYLEKLYTGILNTQNVHGDLQKDQAMKLCKLSLELESKIREGEEVDKLLRSYDTLVKLADFTPKNIKNASDFESVGEVVAWMEKRGWKNKFYDDVSRDIVDETLKNIKAYNRRLYTNETGIGDEINQRIKTLENSVKQEQIYNLDLEEANPDEYDSVGYNELMNEDEDFSAELEE